MKTNKIILSCLFFIVLAIDIYATPKHPEIRLIVKPMLMPILLLLYIINSNRHTANRFAIIGALLFSMLGDILLLSEKELYFLLGIGGFLLAQVCYIFYFSKEIRGTKMRPLIIPFVFFLFGFLGLIYNHIIKTNGDKQFLLPITIYAIVIVTMCYFATIRSKTPYKPYILVLTGAILFLISDSCIAVNSFLLNEQNEFLGKFIMISYGFAQYLIVAGVTIRAKS